MNEEMVVALVRDVFYYVLLISGPLLALSLVMGLGISIFQAATSISEQTLTFVPKLVVVFIGSVVAMPFMLQNLKAFTIEIFHLIPTLK